MRHLTHFYKNTKKEKSRKRLKQEQRPEGNQDQTRCSLKLIGKKHSGWVTGQMLSQSPEECQQGGVSEFIREGPDEL